VDDRVDVDSDQLEVVLERDVPGEVAIDADAGVEGRGIKGPAAASLSSSAVMIRSKPLSANTRANSSPIPVDAPVTRTSGRPVLVVGFWCPCTVFTSLSGFAEANDSPIGWRWLGPGCPT
jgi:hypothetical protein